MSRNSSPEMVDSPVPGVIPGRTRVHGGAADPSPTGLRKRPLRPRRSRAPVTVLFRRHVMADAQSGVNGTPTFFINGDRLDWDFETRTIERALDDARRPV